MDDKAETLGKWNHSGMRGLISAPKNLSIAFHASQLILLLC